LTPLDWQQSAVDGADQRGVVGFGLIDVAPRVLAQCLINPGVELLQAQGGLGKTHIAPDTLEQPRPGIAVEHGELLRGEAQRAPTLVHVAVRHFDNAMHGPIRHWRVDLSPRWIRLRWTLRPLAAG
jgi:hypothetical protein